jgi:hypothetical protein
MAPHLNRYMRDGLMDQLAPVGTKPLRTIPIGGTIEDPRRIAPYEDVMSIVESQNFIAVSIVLVSWFSGKWSSAVSP